MIYFAIRKRKGQFLFYNNSGNYEFFEAEGKPEKVSWTDFVKIILQNKYGFAKQTIDRVSVVEPLFVEEGNLFVYVELDISRYDSHLPLHFVTYPVRESIEKYDKIVRGSLNFIKFNLEGLNLWS